MRFGLHAVAVWWFMGQGWQGAQSSEHVLFEDETPETCLGVKVERSSLLLSLTFSLPGPPEVGKSVSKEGMARESDRRTSRPQVTAFS